MKQPLPPAYWRDFAHLPETRAVVSSRFTASDGCALYVYECGERARPAVVLVAPIGMPFLLFAKLAVCLSRWFYVVSWELRGAAYLDDGGGPPPLQRHAEDLLEIARAKSVTCFHVVGWCSAACVIVCAADRIEPRLQTISLVAPGCIGAHEQKSNYQSYFWPLMMAIASSDEARARSAYRVIEQMDQSRHAKKTHADDVLRLTSLNLKDFDTTRRFAALLRSRSEEERDGRIHSLFDKASRKIPTMIIHAKDDDIVDYRCSIDASQRNRSVRLVLYPSGTHFLPYTAHEPVSRDICRFIEGRTTIDVPQTVHIECPPRSRDVPHEVLE